MRTFALIDCSTGPAEDCSLGSEAAVDMVAMMLNLDGRFRATAMASRRVASIESSVEDLKQMLFCLFSPSMVQARCKKAAQTEHTKLETGRGQLVGGGSESSWKPYAGHGTHRRPRPAHTRSGGRASTDFIPRPPPTIFAPAST